MADGVFNIAKGRVTEFHNRVNDSDPTNAELVIVLLSNVTVQTDAQMRDHTTLNALLAVNSEATFTNYVRKFLTDADITAPTYDQANDWTQVDITVDPTWSAAGGTLDETLSRVIIGYDFDGNATGNDTTIIPMTFHDFTPTTNGNDLVLQIDANGYFRATQIQL